jgi:cyclophilin family peptidyl-prolyl cis-trans isomerase
MRLLSVLTLVVWSLFSMPAFSEEKTANPVIVMQTTKGDITIELYPDKSPITVNNFLGYVKSGFYDGTIFHRVIRRFAVQGGGFTPDLIEKPSGESIVNESKSSKLINDRWTVAMARTDDPNSARSQFFINMRMNLNLDARAGRDGYAVFGEVIDGHNVVRDIAISKTRSAGGMRDVPVEAIVIIGTTLK